MAIEVIGGGPVQGYTAASLPVVPTLPPNAGVTLVPGDVALVLAWSCGAGQPTQPDGTCTLDLGDSTRHLAVWNKVLTAGDIDSFGRAVFGNISYDSHSAAPPGVLLTPYLLRGVELTPFFGSHYYTLSDGAQADSVTDAPTLTFADQDGLNILASFFASSSAPGAPSVTPSGMTLRHAQGVLIGGTWYNGTSWSTPGNGTTTFDSPTQSPGGTVLSSPGPVAGAYSVNGVAGPPPPPPLTRLPDNALIASVRSGAVHRQSAVLAGAP